MLIHYYLKSGVYTVYFVVVILVIFRKGVLKKITLYQYSRSQLEINFVNAVQCALKYTTMVHLVHLHQY